MNHYVKFSFDRGNSDNDDNVVRATKVGSATVVTCFVRVHVEGLEPKPYLTAVVDDSSTLRAVLAGTANDAMKAHETIVKEMSRN